jgi:enoyl-CoA hydratase
LVSECYRKDVHVTHGNRHVHFELESAVAVVTIDRPAARNALNGSMLVALADIWAEINRDESIRCAILTGAGGEFSSGADLKDAIVDPGDEDYDRRVQSDPDVRWRGLLRHYTLDKPLITAIEGHAMAGGMELVLASDIRVASASAIFGLPEVRRGLYPAAGGSVRLPRQIPRSVAMDIMLTGRAMDAKEAWRLGLVARLVGVGQALDEARGIAKAICANAPLAVRAIKRAVRETEAMSEADALARELEIAKPVLMSEDSREGMRAFAEKRPAQFSGR